MALIYLLKTWEIGSSALVWQSSLKRRLWNHSNYRSWHESKSLQPQLKKNKTAGINLEVRHLQLDLQGSQWDLQNRHLLNHRNGQRYLEDSSTQPGAVWRQECCLWVCMLQTGSEWACSTSRMIRACFVTIKEVFAADSTDPFHRQLIERLWV